MAVGIANEARGRPRARRSGWPRCRWAPCGSNAAAARMAIAEQFEMRRRRAGLQRHDVDLARRRGRRAPPASGPGSSVRLPRGKPVLLVEALARRHVGDRDRAVIDSQQAATGPALSRRRRGTADSSSGWPSGSRNLTAVTPPADARQRHRAVPADRRRARAAARAAHAAAASSVTSARC